MAEAYDVIVIGLGAMGSAALHQVAGRGRSVLGLDMFPLGHANGSSHGHHRMIRRSTYQHGFAPLIDRSFELWRDLEAASGREIMRMLGEVSMGLPPEQFDARGFAADRTLGGKREILSERELNERFPGFRLHEGHIATFEAEAGILRPEIAIAAHLELAARNGAAIQREEEALDWSVDGDGVVVRTNRGRYRADRLIVTTGPWASELLGTLDLPLQVVRIVNVYFEPSRPEWWTAERGAPDFLLAVPEGQFYGMPSIDGAGLKIGRHDSGRPTTPRTIQRDIDGAEREYLRAVLDRYMPGASGPVVHELTCMYTMTPDEYYVVERHPEHPRVAYGCGFSGTGFKFSAAVGEILADLALDGATRLDISMFSSSRFSA